MLSLQTLIHCNKSLFCVVFMLNWWCIRDLLRIIFVSQVRAHLYFIQNLWAPYLLTILFSIICNLCAFRIGLITTVMFLSFGTDMPGQTVQTRIRLVYTVCHSVCIVWTHYSMVETHSSNFREITTNILGVRIFRKFMVTWVSFKL